MLADHEMSVGPGYPKGVHACQTSLFGPVRPVHLRRGHLDGQTIPVDGRIGVAKVKVFRNHTLVHHQNGFDQSGDSGSRLQMADVGLDRADQEGVIRQAVRTEHVGYGVDLDRITYSSAGAVGLQIINIGGSNLRIGKSRRHHLFQSGGVRDGQANAGASMVDRRSSDHRPDPISVGLRLAEPLQDNHAAAFTPDVSVGRGVECFALTVGR